jgi:outer membrane protein assembly factor BamB
MNSAPPAAQPSSTPARRPRLWPLVAVLIAHYGVLQATHNFDLWMFTRFMGRLVSTAVVLLVFLVWWLTNRNYRWTDKLLAIALLVAAIAVADIVGDPSISAMGLVLDAVPVFFALSVAMLYAVRSAPVAVHRAGYVAMLIGVFGLASMLRWNGVDGRQQGSYSWRWTPTSEQQFLAGRGSESSAVAPPPRHDVALQPGDWAGFRGGDKENSVLAPPLGDWKSSPPKLIWKQRVGPAWSSVSIIDGMAITQEQRGEQECVVAYDAATGKERWVHEDKLRFDEPLSGAGPRGTPAFCDGRIYTYGGTGRLNCLDAADGKVVWTKDLLQETGGKPPMFGASTSPLVIGHMIVVFAGGTEGRGLLAFDAETGKEIWKTPAGTETFSTPQRATLQGVEQILMHDKSGLFGVSIDDGKRLWFHPTDSEMSIPMLQPHILPDGDIITDWNDGIARLAVSKDGDSWSVTEKWKSNRIKPGFNEYVIHEGHIYGLDDGIFCCLEVETGKRLWKKGRYGAGQMLLIPEQSKILVLGEKGDVILVAASPVKPEELGTFQAIQGKTWQHPLIAHGMLFVRNAEQMACFDLSRRTTP